MGYTNLNTKEGWKILNSDNLDETSIDLKTKFVESSNSFVATFGDIQLLDTAAADSSGIFIQLRENTSGYVRQDFEFWSTVESTAKGISINPNEDIILTGDFKTDLVIGNDTLSTNENKDIFLAKLDPFGTVQWVKSAGGIGIDEALAVETDTLGNTYLTGYISGPATFNQIQVTVPAGQQSLFLAKYDTTGQVVWVRTGYNQEGSDISNVKLTVVNEDEVVLAGDYSGTLQLEGAAQPMTSGQEVNQASFIAKYTPDGSVSWAKPIGEANDIKVGGLVADNQNEIMVAGEFSGLGNFVEGRQLSSAGGLDLYFVKFGTDGQLVSAKRVGASGDETLSDLVTDGDGHFVYIGQNADGDCEVQKYCGLDLALLPESDTTSCSTNSELGNLVVAATDGVEPYQYNWSNGQSGPVLSDAETGVYQVTVTDAENCLQILEVAVVDTCICMDLYLSEASYTHSCLKGSEGGNLEELVDGGQAPYIYQWSDGGTSQYLQDKFAGTYTLTVTDANGCQGIETFEITEPEENLNIAVAPESRLITCKVEEPGSIILEVSGGYPPYQYSWNTGETTASLSGLLSSGTYEVTVTDANGCQSIFQQEINEALSDIVLTLDSSSETDFCGSDSLGGYVKVNVSGGQAPYQYEWSNGALTDTLANVEAGNYTLTVTDLVGCGMVLNVNIMHLYVDPGILLSGPNVVSQEIECGESIGLSQVESSIYQGIMISGDTSDIILMSNPTAAAIASQVNGTTTDQNIDYQVWVYHNCGVSSDTIQMIYQVNYALPPTISLSGPSHVTRHFDCGEPTLGASEINNIIFENITSSANTIRLSSPSVTEIASILSGITSTQVIDYEVWVQDPCGNNSESIIRQFAVQINNTIPTLTFPLSQNSLSFSDCYGGISEFSLRNGIETLVQISDNIGDSHTYNYSPALSSIALSFNQGSSYEQVSVRVTDECGENSNWLTIPIYFTEINESFPNNILPFSYTVDVCNNGVGDVAALEAIWNSVSTVYGTCKTYQLLGTFPGTSLTNAINSCASSHNIQFSFQEISTGEIVNRTLYVGIGRCEVFGTYSISGNPSTGVITRNGSPSSCSGLHTTWLRDGQWIGSGSSITITIGGSFQAITTCTNDPCTYYYSNVIQLEPPTTCTGSTNISQLSSRPPGNYSGPAPSNYFALEGLFNYPSSNCSSGNIETSWTVISGQQPVGSSTDGSILEFNGVPVGTYLFEVFCISSNGSRSCIRSSSWINNGGSIAVYPEPLNFVVDDQKYKLYPNPTKDEAFLDFYLEKDIPINKSVEIRFFDRTGKLVRQMNPEIHYGLNHLTLNTDDLVSGVYFVGIQLGDKVKMKKLVILK